MNVSLTPELEAFVHDKVASGRYTSASEVVRESLRLLEEREWLRERRIDDLRKDIQIGIDELQRGEGITLNSEKEKEEFFEDIKRRGRERLKQKQSERGR
ncbi:MAG: type II toxin-antitoxin system ParD family antitoxin [Pyrinomonadaceae bacterium]